MRYEGFFIDSGGGVTVTLTEGSMQAICNLIASHRQEAVREELDEVIPYKEHLDVAITQQDIPEEIVTHALHITNWAAQQMSDNFTIHGRWGDITFKRHN
jgi:hypothetical protein